MNLQISGKGRDKKALFFGLNIDECMTAGGHMCTCAVQVDSSWSCSLSSGNRACRKAHWWVGGRVCLKSPFLDTASFWQPSPERWSNQQGRQKCSSRTIRAFCNQHSPFTIPILLLYIHSDGSVQPVLSATPPALRIKHYTLCTFMLSLRFRQ